MAVLSVAFLVPAVAASASPLPTGGHTNASCNNGRGGNSQGSFNDHGRLGGTGACAPVLGPEVPVDSTTDTPVTPPTSGGLDS